jgi:hypothetical protein
MSGVDVLLQLTLLPERVPTSLTFERAVVGMDALFVADQVDVRVARECARCTLPFQGEFLASSRGGLHERASESMLTLEWHCQVNLVLCILVEKCMGADPFALVLHSRSALVMLACRSDGRAEA